jgi:methionine-rich copper-binding protein CopC
MQQIAYANTSDSPLATVQIDWVFNDGNTGTQGTGGALNITGSTTVQIISTPDNPLLIHPLGDQSVVTGSLLSYSLPSDSFTNPDGGTLTYQAFMVDGSGIPPWLTFNTATGIFTGTPEASDIGVLNIKVTATGDNYISGMMPAPIPLSVSDDFIITVSAPDITAPTLSSIYPIDNATGIKASANLTLTFSEAIQKGAGTIQIHSGSATGTVIESYDVANSANLTITEGNKLVIDPTATLSLGTHYFVTLDAGSVEDLAGNNYAGITTYDFTTAAATYSVNENVTFWKTGAALSGATSSLVSVPTTTSPVEFKNLQIVADGSHTLEIWETSTGIDSLQMQLTLPNGAVTSWQDAKGLPTGWTSSANTEVTGQFGLAGFGVTSFSAGAVKLGTLTITNLNQSSGFEISLSAGSLGEQAVTPFSINPDITNTSIDGLYQHIDIAEGSYNLSAAKAASSIGSAIKANDALAALKIAVGINPNSDASAVSFYQYLAADINHDGKVSAVDALNILKMAVNLSTAPEKSWFFVPEMVVNDNMTRSNVIWSDTVNPVTVDHNQTLHLVGIVSGDVNGSWVEPLIA